jgi:hypothetical protein
MAKRHLKPTGIVVIIFSDEYHFGVYHLHRVPSSEQLTDIAKKAIAAFESSPFRKTIIRFWDMGKNEGLLSYEWSWPKASKVLISGYEKEDSIPKEFSQQIWDIVDTIGVGLIMSVVPIGPLEHRRHEEKLRASRPAVFKALKQEFQKN